MGCISSKTELEEIHPHMFQVMNVDEMGNSLSPGQLEITETDLVFHQQGKAPIRWPLRSLRRYGYDSDVFSFESGRRCPTGPGIYAFRSRRAEQLFNQMQSRIQLRSNADNDISGSVPVFQIPNQARSDYLEPAPMRRSNPSSSSRFSFQNGITTRLSSVGSASGSVGPLSPQSGSTLPSDIAPPIPPLPAPSRPSSQNIYANDAASLNLINSQEETNNNKSSPTHPVTPTSSIQHTYTNASAILEALPQNTEQKEINETGYELLGEMSSPSIENDHLYMNVIPGTDNVIPISCPPPQQSPEWDPEEPKHFYANLDPEEIDCISRQLFTKTLSNVSVPTTPPGVPVKSINYIVLDLEPNNSDPPKTPTSLYAPESLQKGYATIDFDKTVALSHSVNPNFVDNDSEGSRKTRHNSTINDLISQTRHSSSLSD